MADRESNAHTREREEQACRTREPGPQGDRVDEEFDVGNQTQDGDAGFHDTPDNFDAPPERHVSERMLGDRNQKPADGEAIYFTRVLTDRLSGALRIGRAVTHAATADPTTATPA